MQTEVKERVKLDRFNVTASNAVTPVSTIRLSRDGKLVEQVAASDGPINASFKAISQILGVKVNLETFQLTAITGGRCLAAQGELQTAFLGVLEELRTRYLLRVTPQSTKPGWHEIKIRLRRGDADVRARPGFWRPEPEKRTRR